MLTRWFASKSELSTQSNSVLAPKSEFDESPILRYDTNEPEISGFSDLTPLRLGAPDPGLAGGLNSMKKIESKLIVKLEVKKHSQRGKYVYKPLVSIVVICGCGNKYVSTRPKQKTCIMKKLPLAAAALTILTGCSSTTVSFKPPSYCEQREEGLPVVGMDAKKECDRSVWVEIRAPFR